MHIGRRRMTHDSSSRPKMREEEEVDSAAETSSRSWSPTGPTNVHPPSTLLVLLFDICCYENVRKYPVVR